MPHLQEVIFCATAPQASDAGAGVIALHDIETGSSLASFKQTSSAPHCTCFIDTRDGQGGFIMAAQPDKSILNVYNFQKDQIALKIVLPEKLTCIALDCRGDYCAGGTSQGRIYLWEVASGILYNSWDAHYQKVNVLRFTHDGAGLVSGSEDSGVSVWSVSRLVDDSLQTELPAPFCTLSDHTLPVTDIICGVGAFPSCRILTASVDHTVKLWDLSSRALLTTFHFPKPVTCLSWDVTERLFFAASPDGSIHQANLFRQRADNIGGQVVEAVGGGGVNDVIRIGDEDEHVRRKRLISVGQPVTALAISLTSSLLLVGTSTGLVYVYDIASHQLLRTISTHKGSSISYITSMFKPPDLIGHISLTLDLKTLADAKNPIPVRTVVPFQRMRESKAREAHEVSIMLPIQNKCRTNTLTPYSCSSSEFHRDYAYFVQPVSSESGGVSLQSRVAELEGEVTRLQEQLGKAKGVNDTMWETVVQRVIAQGKEKKGKEAEAEANGDTGDSSEDSGRARKKGRQ
ncbi:hypothetical protein SERLA73DRAFT_184727 [Serpula lacrymans var. lacrymans S7.3]|uniref:Pre-rRNA-processing protein IPI3 n=2 Tax=Serpula lacrymans var. lacrymans TaxID=341189 RepID=F8Q4Z7_SERL3|nr:uncharacterized protein SERLADRAFT_472666 [Serpula lacrymans var. lacrymans S7.9]EGN96624.1 hypothetical protein SERLA73DRAFT_184727 [Serpula lacrymans var. lacrymans S7.3]EGO22192.1 hypothetical protein SERLADRAFT_472666 [Serpula lacrymans var. lacrymans S7.9]